MSNPHRRARRAKRYVPRAIHYPMLVKTYTVMMYLDAILDQIERDGTVNTDQRGVPIFYVDNMWYESVPAIRGLIDMFEIWADRHERCLPLQPLRQLANRLECGMLVFEADLQALRRVLPILGRVAAQFGHEEARGLVRVTQIRAELEARTV